MPGDGHMQCGGDDGCGLITKKWQWWLPRSVIVGVGVRRQWGRMRGAALVGVHLSCMELT